MLHLIQKEILEHILSLRFLILAIVGALAIWISLYDGYSYYTERVDDFRSAQAGTDLRLRQIQESEGLVRFAWYELNNVGFYNHKPPVFLSIFIRGLDPTLGRTVSNAMTISERRLRRTPVETRPILGIFPTLDLCLVVQMVLSLFVLLFAYDAVSGEKERGTLRLIGSFSLPGFRLLMGKLIGLLVPIVVSFVVPILLGISVILVLPKVQVEDSDWLPLLLIFVSLILYLAVHACVGLFASCLTHKSSTSFVLLLGFWVATAVMIPRLGLITADAIRPAPSIHEHEARKKIVAFDYLRKTRDARSRWEEEYKVRNNEDWWETPEGREAEREHSTRARKAIYDLRLPELDKLENRFRNSYNTRLDLAVSLARSSPTFAFRNAVIQLAGTGTGRHYKLQKAYTRTYHREYVKWFETTSDVDLLRRWHPEKYGKPVWDISGMPRFTYLDTEGDSRIQSSFQDIAFLALWAILFFVGSLLAIIRYDLR